MLSIIIVDDEVSTLHGIAHILRRYPAEFEVASEASSAVQALEVLERLEGEIDVVLTDVRMPVMSGVQLVKILALRYPHVRVVVLSAHGDYDYVRDCMKHGAVDYLLKPCRYQALLSVLRRIAGDKLTREREKLMEDTRNHLYDIILTDAPGSAEGLTFEPVYLVCLRPFPGANDAIDRLQAYLHNALPPQTHESPQHYILDMQEDLVLLLDGQFATGDAEAFFSSRLAGISESIGLSAETHAALSEREPLASRVRACRKLCDFLAFNAISRPASLDEKEAFSAQVVPSGFSGYWTLSHLLPLLRLENKDALDQAFARLADGFGWPNGLLNPVELKREAVRLLSGLEQNAPRQMLEAGDYLSDSYIMYIERVNRAARPDELLTILYDYLSVLNETLHRASPQPQFIADAKQYIKSHYMENLLLSDVAQAVYLNEWYFSSQFKKHSGVSFKEYLNAVRIDVAKRLLQENDLKVGQIAEMVGFSNSTYFSTAFKHSTGITPKEYRRTVIMGEEP